MEYGPGETQPRHAHATTSVTLLVSGEIEERVGSRVAHAGALSVAVKPAGVEHSDRIGSSGSWTVQMELDPRSEVVATLEDDLLSSWLWVQPSRACGPFLGLLEALRFEGYGSDALVAAAYDAMAVLASERSESVGRTPPTWLKQVADELDATFAEPASVGDLARRAGVHPVSLARAFRRHYGMSITERVRARRISEATQMLRAPQGTVAAVAHAVGFADQAHLCRVFRRATGMTPSRFSRIARS